MIALIGSAAYYHHIETDKVPKDLDIVGTYDDIISYIKSSYDVATMYPISGGKKMYAKTKGGLNIEAEIAWPGSIAEKLYHLILLDDETLVSHDCYVASLDVLYMLKMSHRYLRNSPHFLKTMRHIHEMRSLGARIRPEHQTFYDARMKATYDYSHPSLMRNKATFFSDDGVGYVYHHDDIHLVVKYDEMPAYEYFKSDTHDVWCDKNKFFRLPEQVRLNAVVEESLVLAIERSQVPFPETDRIKSFEMALMKVCTSITSGWFREYAWENYDLALKQFMDTKQGYVEVFWKAVEDGKVRKV